MENLQQPKLRFNTLLFYAITITALVIIYLKFSEIKNIKAIFADTNNFWIFVIVLLQFIGAYFLAINYQMVLLMKGKGIALRELFPVTFVVQFLNQAIPSATIAGQVFFVQYLRKHKLSIIEGMSRAILEFATLYVAFGILFITSIILIFQNHIFETHLAARMLVYLFSFFALLFLFIFFVIQRKKRSKLFAWLILKIHYYFDHNHYAKKATEAIKKIHFEHVSTMLEQIKSTMDIKDLRRKGWLFGSAILWQVLMLLAQVMTLYITPVALGQEIPFLVVFIVFTLTKFISMVVFVPGALGIFEGGMTLMFVSFGVPSALAISTTILFRAFTFWFPMPIGWLLYRHYNRKYIEGNNTIGT